MLNARAISPPSGLPAISPTSGEISHISIIALFASLQIGEIDCEIQSPHLRGRWPAGQRGAGTVGISLC
jgi:hypothetical protein